MSEYVDLKVVAQVIAAGLLLGAGLPLVFAAGLKALSAGTNQVEGVRAFEVTRNPAAIAAAAVCFLAVAAGILFGLYIITHKG